MLLIQGGVLDEFTCQGAKPLVGWFPCGGGRCGLLQKVLKSGAFCAIELTSCIDLTMAMSRLFMAS